MFEFEFKFATSTGREAPKSGLPDLGSQTCRNRQQPISVAPLPTLQAIPTRPGTAIGRLGSWSSRGNHKGRPQREGSPTAGNAGFGACYANIAPSNGPALDRSQGCSTLFEEFHLGEGFDPSESGGVSILGDGVGLIEAEDIVGEAA